MGWLKGLLFIIHIDIIYFSPFKYDKLKASVADHLDHLHYLNDILQLRIDLLNIILTDHMINRLLIPLYIYSLPSKDDVGKKDPDRVRISKLVALFLLAQVKNFLLSYGLLLRNFFVFVQLFCSENSCFTPNILPKMFALVSCYHFILFY